jgi:tetratricopeptide (TPR) repeat protein
MAALAADWISRSAWHLRSAEFGPLVSDAGTVGIELAGVSDELWRQWVSLPRYPTIMQALRPTRLRYAAIDWTTRPITLGDAPSYRRIAARGIEIAQTFEWLLQNVSVDNAAWFANPIVMFDLEGELRLAFLTRGDAAPPESLLNFPHCDERGFVYVVGKLMRRMVHGPVGEPLSTIIDRSTAEPGLRFATLDKLVEELRHLGASPRPRAHLRNPRRHWTHVERGLGLLAVGSNHAASVCFADAMKVARGFELAHELYTYALSLPAPPVTAAGEIPHRDVVVVPAMAIVDVQILRHAAPPELPNPRPRRVYAIANGAVTSSAIGVGMQPSAAEEAPLARLLRTHRYDEALAICDTAIGDEPDAAAHHHLRGKSLLGLGRLDDARAAFDRACTLEPKLLEAMLLRREVDRAILAARGAAGTAQPMRMALPPHLAELRDVLIAGRLVDAIQMLRRPEYDDDTVAQLLRAELLCSDGRAEEALEIYDRIAIPAARLGRVRALITLDRAAEALAEVEPLIGVDDEALELRARALFALDRSEEAEAQLGEYLHVVAQRSERRVRSL